MYVRLFEFALLASQVFLAEYIGPLLIYPLFYFRIPYIYRRKYTLTSSPHPVVTLACICYSLHYFKRLIETIFVHRFSHGTMPLQSAVRNCIYYWGCAAWLAYYINHPLYTPPSYGNTQVNFALVMFVVRIRFTGVSYEFPRNIGCAASRLVSSQKYLCGFHFQFCEVGNFSIHLALKNLQNGGSKSRKIPHPSKNPFTWLFFFVSCPNYTYEVGAWISLTIMTQTLPVAVFTVMGFVQMAVWAKEKHKTYNREFKNYPKLRMSIIPFIF
ncbi:very-long-chain enoyl-CoA reductase-like [Scleropages formosus]|uniref:Very-long-chain enoyl-CoA reductase-like n=1 Tax=Scleropages formosus TaxID=113540 RepID=A0A0P7WAU4_SCLFO|nr:very-long-chain enoyl-CoA reductase-like [Scleropages formosus]